VSSLKFGECLPVAAVQKEGSLEVHLLLCGSCELGMRVNVAFFLLCLTPVVVLQGHCWTGTLSQPGTHVLQVS
jgi:hypothetical protein